jgi:hypothetical protein
VGSLEILNRDPSTEFPVPRQTSLATLERRVLAPARQADIDLRFFGVTLPPAPDERVRVVTDARGGHWALAPPIEDPTRERGLIPVPRIQLEKLRSLNDVGVELDYLYVAHQLPDHWRPGEPIPELVPPPPKIASSERFLARTAAVAGATVRATVIGAGTVLAAPLGLAALDPMVLGGVLSDDGRSAAWAILASWTWSE